MEVSAKLKYLRIAPRKVRLVADLIRGKRAEVAQNILDETHAQKKASKEKAEKAPIPTGQESVVPEFEEQGPQEPKREKTSASKFGGKQKEVAKPKTEGAKQKIFRRQTF